MALNSNERLSLESIIIVKKGSSRQWNYQTCKGSPKSPSLTLKLESITNTRLRGNAVVSDGYCGLFSILKVLLWINFLHKQANASQKQLLSSVWNGLLCPRQEWHLAHAPQGVPALKPSDQIFKVSMADSTCSRWSNIAPALEGSSCYGRKMAPNVNL